MTEEGGFIGSLLLEVPGTAGDEGGEGDHDEEREARHRGDVPGVWDEDVQNREGLTPGVAGRTERAAGAHRSPVGSRYSVGGSREVGSEDLDDVVVEKAVGGDGGIAEGGGAVPLAEGAAGLADDWLEGRGVPGAHVGIEHDFGAAGGDEEVAVAVAPGAGEAAALDEGTVSDWTAGGGACEGCHREGGVFEGGDGRNAAGLAVEAGAPAERGSDGFADGVAGDDSEDGLAVAFEGDEGSEEGYPVDE